MRKTKAYYARKNEDGTYGELTQASIVNFSETKPTDEEKPIPRFDCEPMTLEIQLVREEDLNGILETTRTCKNCGASVHGNRCEYCGSEYREVHKMIFDIGGKTYG